MHLVQWNLNGFYARLPFLQLLKKKICPTILCLQETNFKHDHCGRITGYNPYFKNRQNAAHASGGVAIFVKNNYPSDQIFINTALEAVAVTVETPTKITICTVYIPNSYALTSMELKNLVRQLPKPFILVGDFNSHNPLWGSEKIDARGKAVESWLDDTDLVILNSNEPTHHNLSSGTFSCIDLSICSASISHMVEWTVENDLYDSDHFPLNIRLINGSDSNRLPIAPVRPPNWNFKKANWALYTDMLNDIFKNLPTPNPSLNTDVDTVVTSLGAIIESAADHAIPRSSGKIVKTSVPWWNEKCKTDIKAAKHAFNRYKKHPTSQTRIEFKKLRAAARRTVKTAKKEAWHSFIRSINRTMPTDQIWKAIKRIQGQSQPRFSPFLSDSNNQPVTDISDMANLLADTFAENCNDKNYDKSFLQYKKAMESCDANARLNREPVLCHDDPINSNFRIEELKVALDSCNNSSPGPDGIPTILIKHFPDSALSFLLAVYNLIWITDSFPTSWRLATIIPIPKPGKDKTKTSNYRPIALTCNLCKLLEKMVNRRLRWFLEQKNWFSPNQSGFRQLRSTTDHLIQFEENICDALANNLHLIAVSIDVEKAYEMVWKRKITSTLRKIGLSGHIIDYIENFLCDRSIQIKIGNVLSKITKTENGVPQGSVISVTLFLVAINDIFSPLKPPVHGLLFADDFTIFCSGKEINNTRMILQESLDNLHEWSKKSGFKFSKTKTEFIVFTRASKPSKLKLYLGNAKLKRSHALKILGMTFDPTLSWKPHVKTLKAQCMKRVNILKSLASKNWGADRSILLNTYKATIRSKLDYGSIIYNSGMDSVLKTLNSVQTSALRLATGAFRSSPNVSVLAEAQELPLEVRRKGLSLSYIPSYQRLQNTSLRYLETIDPMELSYETRPVVPKPFRLRSKKLSHELGTRIPPIRPKKLNPLPPWFTIPLNIDLELFNNTSNKSNTPSITFQALFKSMICCKYQAHAKIFTDGSIINEERGCSVILEDTEVIKKLPKEFSIMSCEAYAMLEALKLLDTTSTNPAVIFSDSKSTLDALANVTNTNGLIQDLQTKLVGLTAKGIEVALCWVPSHVGITGNDKADKAAKRAATSGVLDTLDIPISSQEFKSSTYKTLREQWNEVWTTSEPTKLHRIRTDIFEKAPDTDQRKSQCVLTRLRIGHTNLTHRYLFERKPKPLCPTCNTVLTVEHFLIVCPEHQYTRSRLRLPSTLKNCLNNAKMYEKVIEFCKCIMLFDKL